MSQVDDFAAIAAVVSLYAEGMCQGDPAKLRQAMHENACSIGHVDGGLEWDTREAFITTVMATVVEPDTAPWHRINAISVTGDTAVVQVEDIWEAMHYDDTLTLLKRNSRWQIVAKVFHYEFAEES